MAYILTLDTSTKVCSAAVFNNTELLAHAQIHNDKSHSAWLTRLIEAVIAFSELKMSDIEAVACSEGPGSYTGLRIGLSAAKGICYANDIPLINVNTLLILASAVKEIADQDSLICPMIDARRMEVYCMLVDSSLREIKGASAEIVDDTFLHEELQKNKVYFTGNGSEKCRTILSNQPNAIFIPGVHPLAQYMGGLATQKFIEGNFSDTAYAEPFYLKEFQAKKPSGKSLL